MRTGTALLTHQVDERREFLVQLPQGTRSHRAAAQHLNGYHAPAIWTRVRLLERWDIMGRGAASAFLGMDSGHPGFGMMALDGSVYVCASTGETDGPQHHPQRRPQPPPAHRATGQRRERTHRHDRPAQRGGPRGAAQVEQRRPAQRACQAEAGVHHRPEQRGRGPPSTATAATTGAQAPSSSPSHRSCIDPRIDCGCATSTSRTIRSHPVGRVASTTHASIAGVASQLAIGGDSDRLCCCVVCDLGGYPLLPLWCGRDRVRDNPGRGLRPAERPRPSGRRAGDQIAVKTAATTRTAAARPCGRHSAMPGSRPHRCRSPHPAGHRRRTPILPSVVSCSMTLLVERRTHTPPRRTTVGHPTAHRAPSAGQHSASSSSRSAATRSRSSARIHV